MTSRVGVVERSNVTMHATPPLRPVGSARRTTTLWALGLSIVVHIALAAGFVRPPVVRAESPPMATPAPLELWTAAPTPLPRPPTAPPRTTAPTFAPAPLPPPLAPVDVASRPPAARHAPARTSSPALAAPARSFGRPAPSEATERGAAAGSGDGAVGSGQADPSGISGPQPTASLDPTPSPSPSPTSKPACVEPDRPAHAVTVVDPELPEVARSRGESGVVRVRVDLDAAGTVVGTAVDGSSGYADLDRAALAAAEQSRYAAEMQQCRNVAGSYGFVARFEQ